MKATIISCVILLTVMFSLPLRFLKHNTTNNTTVTTLANHKTEKPQKAEVFLPDSFRLLLDGNVVTLSTSDYIMGVLAAEMPLSYNKEALKAQAVAAYTFACHRALQYSDREYDLTADSNTDQAFVPIESAKAMWGSQTDEYLDKLRTVISETKGKMLTYDNLPALTVYHATSPGVTVDCKDVWGESLPYLVSVDSSGDTLCSDFLSSASFSPQELSSLLGVQPQDDLNSWLQNCDVAPSGKVRSITFCSKTFSGGELAELLGLRSSVFTVSLDGENFVFTVKGYGHGVGMSQTGAEYMAQQGADYKEILLHYYTGCILIN